MAAQITHRCVLSHWANSVVSVNTKDHTGTFLGIICKRLSVFCLELLRGSEVSRADGHSIIGEVLSENEVSPEECRAVTLLEELEPAVPEVRMSLFSPSSFMSQRI